MTVHVERVWWFVSHLCLTLLCIVALTTFASKRAYARQERRLLERMGQDLT